MQKKQLLLTLKLAVIALAFAIIFHKADTDRIGHYLTSLHPLAFIAAYLLLNLAQLASAMRSRYYFNTAGIGLSRYFSIGLYYTGMLYNTLLPGGIGGDAYKIFLLGKLTGCPKLTALRLLLSDRASGLFILMMLAFAFALPANITSIIPLPLLVLAAIITIPGYIYSAKLLLKEPLSAALGAMPYSLIVQLANVAMVPVIIWGFAPEITHSTAVSGYIFLFLVSSVLAVLPISIGGVGIRELAFMIGAKYLGLDAELGIALAMLFFIVTLITSLNGLFFWHRLEKLYKSTDGIRHCEP